MSGCAGRIQLHAEYVPDRLASAISSGGVSSVRYSVINGWNAARGGSARRMRLR